MNRPTLSVIVPAHDEQSTIRGCLDCLLEQADDIDEILVVDNDSTDDTAAIVRVLSRSHPTVRLVTEPRRGLAHARTRGFDEARGDILARIDCDTRVGPGWASAITTLFADHGSDFAAGTGLCRCHDLPFQGRFVRMQEAMTRRVRDALRDGELDSACTARLFGSNMMLSREAWRRVRDRQTGRTDVFEDLDLTLPLTRMGLRIALVPGAEATISGRRYLTSPISYVRYCLQDQRTYRAHGSSREAVLSVVTMVTVHLPFYLVMWIPFRLYDPTTRRFGLTNLLRRRDRRGLP